MNGIRGREVSRGDQSKSRSAAEPIAANLETNYPPRSDSEMSLRIDRAAARQVMPQQPAESLSALQLARRELHDRCLPLVDHRKRHVPFRLMGSLGVVVLEVFLQDMP